jgi:hypothetical protein
MSRFQRMQWFNRSGYPWSLWVPLTSGEMAQNDPATTNPPARVGEGYPLGIPDIDFDASTTKVTTVDHDGPIVSFIVLRIALSKDSLLRAYTGHPKGVMELLSLCEV